MIHQSSGARVWTRFSPLCKRIYYIHNVLTYVANWLIDRALKIGDYSYIFRSLFISSYRLFLLLPVKIFSPFSQRISLKRNKKRSLYLLTERRDLPQTVILTRQERYWPDQASLHESKQSWSFKRRPQRPPIKAILKIPPGLASNTCLPLISPVTPRTTAPASLKRIAASRNYVLAVERERKQRGE